MARSAAAAKAREAKADVKATEAKVTDINERRSAGQPGEPTRKPDREWFVKLTSAAKQVARERVVARIEGGETLAKAWGVVIADTKRQQTTEARKAGIEARAAARRQGNGKAGFEDTGSSSFTEARKQQPETVTDPVPPTPPPVKPEKVATKPSAPRKVPSGDRAALYAKAIAAKAQAKADGRKRKGEPVTDEQLAAYIADVRAKAPEAIAAREMEIASWIGGMAFSPARWRAAWAASAKKRAS